MSKNLIKFLGSLRTQQSDFVNLRMQIRKKWLIVVTNIITGIFNNIIRQLLAGESHPVIKITVPY
jgi:hypothetical protein